MNDYFQDVEQIVETTLMSSMCVRLTLVLTTAEE